MVTESSLICAESWGDLHCGDSATVLRTLPDRSVDALVTDPPAGIGFLDADFDRDRGGRTKWIGWLAGIVRECYRVLKPGAHGLVWALPRRSHWTATACEDAGFEIRDVIAHLFGEGMPHGANLGVSIDRLLGQERRKEAGRLTTRYAPVTAGGARWEGWSTALRPASEHWILIRKPLERENTAANVMAHGTGALNVLANRLTAERPGTPQGAALWSPVSDPEGDDRYGRWPANVVLSHDPDCRQTGLLRFPVTSDRPFAERVPVWQCVATCPVLALDSQAKGSLRPDHGGQLRRNGPNSRFMASASDAIDTACGLRRQDPARRFKPGCGSGGTRDPDSPVEYGYMPALTGRAIDYFTQLAPVLPPPFRFVAKASSAERNAGLSGLPSREVLRTGVNLPRTVPVEQNTHPTVKSLALMRWLVRLITPPGGVVLDPFLGSGSTGCAAALEGFRVIGIEYNPEYVEIARRRIVYWAQVAAEAQATGDPGSRRTTAAKKARSRRHPILGATPVDPATVVPLEGLSGDSRSDELSTDGDTNVVGG